MVARADRDVVVTELSDLLPVREDRRVVARGIEVHVASQGVTAAAAAVKGNARNERTVALVAVVDLDAAGIKQECGALIHQVVSREVVVV